MFILMRVFVFAGGEQPSPCEPSSTALTQTGAFGSLTHNQSPHHLGIPQESSSQTSSPCQSLLKHRVNCLCSYAGQILALTSSDTKTICEICYNDTPSRRQGICLPNSSHPCTLFLFGSIVPDTSSYLQSHPFHLLFLCH